MMPTVISEFVDWWSKPDLSPDFSKRFQRPVRYRRGGGMDDENAIWLIEQSLGHEDVEVVSVEDEDGRVGVVLLSTDPVTLLRHQTHFEIVVNGEKIVSVVEKSEILGTSI